MLRQRTKVPCSFTTKAGQPCRAWAVRGSDPPACSSHQRAKSGRQSTEPACSSHQRAKSGRQSTEQACSSHQRAKSGRQSTEQACSSHQRAKSGRQSTEQACSRRRGWEEAWPDDLVPSLDEETPEAGIYRHTLSDEELADLVVYAAGLSLDDEIACARMAVRRTLEYLQERSDSMSEAEYLRATGLVFQGARTIARLLREQKALTGGEDSRLQAIIDAALDGLSEDLGIEL